jgi:hypothetical protein
LLRDESGLATLREINARQIKKRLRAKFVPEINVDRVGAADTMRALVF